MQAVGIDIVEVKRIKTLANKKNKNFINKILHPNEIKILETIKPRSRYYYHFIAGRFALKEAIFKCDNKYAFFNLLDIGYQNKKPVLFYQEKLIDELALSISHDGSYAVGISMLK